MYRRMSSASVSTALPLVALAMSCACFANERGRTPAATVSAEGAPSLLVLHAGTFDPTTHSLAKARPKFEGATHGRYAIVQFESAGDARAVREDLERAGHVVVAFIPNAAYAVRLGPLGLEAIANARAVRWAGAFESHWKIDPVLHPSFAGATEFRNDLEIDGFAGESAARFADALRKAFPEVEVLGIREHAHQPRLRVRMPSAKLQAAIVLLASIDGVFWIAPYDAPRALNDESFPSIQADADTGGPIWDRDLTGSGQVVAVADSGLDRNESWFTQLDQGAGVVTGITDAQSPSLPQPGTAQPTHKVLAYWVQPGATAYDNNQNCSGNGDNRFHGTHVAGSVAGDRGATASPTDPAHDPGGDDGMAPNAQILFQDIGNDVTGCYSITDFMGTLRQAAAGGAHIHSNSWGGGAGGSYNGNDRDADETTWELEDLLVVAAAGNSGPQAGSVLSPGNAKNVLTVGATLHGNSPIEATFSSRGPTRDGRLKPDIVAPGVAIVSAAGNDDNGPTVQAGTSKTFSGTSMATPTIAGGAALLRQYFVDGFYPRGARQASDTTEPNGALMKAVLLNGTRILGEFPTQVLGWGRMFLENTLYFNQAIGGGAGDNRRMRYFERENDAGLLTGQAHEYVIANVGSAEELRATLVWFDPEGAPGAAIHRVNDLDLEVTGPGGLTVYRGNVFVDGASAPNAGAADVRNTVEQIRIVAPAPGRYTLRVRATNVPGNGREFTDRQGYALVVSGAFGIPDATPAEAPLGVAVIGNDTSGVAIGFAGSSSQGYQLYRADGSCASAAAGAFRLVAEGAGSPVVDMTSQGGATHAWRVRGIDNDIEGHASACVGAVSNDDCTRRPTFDTQSLTRDFTNATCSVALDWAPATSNCVQQPSVGYLVERDIDPYFSSPSVIATPSTTAFVDLDVRAGQPYYYRITARDGGNSRSLPTPITNATPVGPGGPAGVGYLDDVDDNTYMTMEPPWRISERRASTGQFAYHNAGDGQDYLASTCASLTTPSFIVPLGATLSYAARYDFEARWDGVVVEISADGGASWTDLPPEGGYPGALDLTGNPPANECGYPPTQGAYTGTSSEVFEQKTTDLAAYASRAVMIRWRFTSDSSVEEEGFYLDDVRVSGTPPPADPARMFASGFEDFEGPTTCNEPRGD